MKKRIIRLTENDLHKIIKESVKNVIVNTKRRPLREGFYDDSTTDEVYQEYLNMRSHSFMAPDESCELGIVYDPNADELYSGFISNAGCNREWAIPYDHTMSFDQNLEALYDEIQNNWEWDEDYQ